MACEVIVIGGGAIGLALSRELARDHSVLILERGLPGRQASWAAAGMLCPHGEAAGDGPLFRLGLRSLELYPAFVEELQTETGVDVEYLDDGTLVLASTEEERRELEARLRWQARAGLETSWLDPGQVRAEEPGLSMDVLGALLCGADHQLRPRRLLEALRKSCRIRGVRILSGARVERIRISGSQVEGVECDRTLKKARVVVVAAGAWSGQIPGLEPPVETRPRKGQILALETPASTFRHVVRWRNFYFAPRKGGALIVGATDEDCGFDRRLTVQGMGQLLDAARHMSEGTGDYRILDAWTGLRPEVADGLPVIGPAGPGGLFYAFGHYRNGILHTPVTARILADLIRGRDPGDLEPALTPLRFSAAAGSRAVGDARGRDV
jgi:glycine oxidase